ncbi:hypothetical protein EIP86_004070 [Pleurotus ostreatoroseus]|nr:hypothetical protein EIP86_004070 [Pleurotus ostreatoroseus]
MSFSIDDIWDEPVASGSAPQAQIQTQAHGAEHDDDVATRPSPAKRRRTTLFLSSDSEDGNSPQRKTQPLLIPNKAPPRTPKRADIEALFEDLDDDDELAPALNVDQLRKEAASKLPPLTPHALLSSSPPRDFGDDTNEGTGAGGKKGKDGEGLHKRKLRPKLDEARLIGSDGFPALVKQAKHFRPKGKRHEARICSYFIVASHQLMQIYQFWSHKMYPNNRFEANVQRIEQLCHTRRMVLVQNSVGIWKDQFHGTINGLKPEELNDGGESDSDSETEAKIPALDVSMQAASSSPPRPASSSSRVIDVEDDWDIDAVIREAQERERTTASSPVKGTVNGVSTPASNPPKASDAPTPPPPQPLTVSTSTAQDDEDAAMWDAFDIDEAALLAAAQEPTTRAPPPASAPPPAQMMDDEDEDMWDAVREIEEQQMAQTRDPQASGSATHDLQGGNKTIAPPTNDEGWDEMYL